MSMRPRVGMKRRVFLGSLLAAPIAAAAGVPSAANEIAAPAFPLPDDPFAPLRWGSFAWTTEAT